MNKSILIPILGTAITVSMLLIMTYMRNLSITLEAKVAILRENRKDKTQRTQQLKEVLDRYTHSIQLQKDASKIGMIPIREGTTAIT
jgi:hypothetical protein